MGRKKKRQQQRRTVPKPKRQNAETGGPVAKAARLAVGDRLDGSRRRLTSGHVAALVVLSLVCGAAALVARFAGKAADDFPAAMASAPAENQPTIDDFVGADGWRECHAQQYEAWRGGARQGRRPAE